jgi:hypothetical protein
MYDVNSLLFKSFLAASGGVGLTKCALMKAHNLLAPSASQEFWPEHEMAGSGLIQVDVDVY